ADQGRGWDQRPARETSERPVPSSWRFVGRARADFPIPLPELGRLRSREARRPGAGLRFGLRADPAAGSLPAQAGRAAVRGLFRGPIPQPSPRHPDRHRAVIVTVDSGAQKRGLVLNYQITGEMATRAVVRLDFDRDPLTGEYDYRNPHLV